MSKFGASGDIDLSLPITSTYLRRMRALGLATGFDPNGAYAKEVRIMWMLEKGRCQHRISFLTGREVFRYSREGSYRHLVVKT